MILAVLSNLVYVIHQQHNDVKQINEKHYEFYAGEVEVRDDRKWVQFSLGFLMVL
jgi:hypothetical protein